MARRHRRGRRGRRTGQQGWLDRIWRRLTDPTTIGAVLVVTGVLCVLAPWTQAPEVLEASWWESSLSPPAAVSVVAGLLAAIIVLLVGALWNRYRLATDPDSEERRGADAVFEAHGDELGVRESRLPGIAWAGAACMAVGVGLVIGGWLYARQGVSPAAVTLSPGETVDHFTIDAAGEELDVMLPLRLRLDGLEAEDDPTAQLQLFEAGSEPPEPQAIEPGSGLEVENFRFTFVGLQSHGAGLRAVLGSDEPDTISQAAAEGETFQLQIDGPEYEVRELTENYQGMLGPAARVRSSEEGDFWVFQEQPESDQAPDFGHSIRLKRLQSQPAAVFSISKDQPFWPIYAGGTLFVLGFALLVVFPERLIRLERRRVRVWSFNESGAVAEDTLEQLDETPSEGDTT